jgi:hypothetical protein
MVLANTPSLQASAFAVSFSTLMLKFNKNQQGLCSNV